MSEATGADAQNHRMKWYNPNPPEIRPETREVLEKYSKIPPDEVVPHVTQIREKAWAIFAYPCIGQWRFLDLWLGFHALYPEILERMRTGDQIFLDLGCAFAQDIRRLVVDGVDSSKCFGSDLRLDFMELGYDLFKDKDTLQSKFIPGDIFDEDSTLKVLDGKVDIIGASAFFHLFDWEQQKAVARRVTKLMKPQQDSLLIGIQVGNLEAGETPGRLGGGGRYRHNLESWQRMWTEIGDELGVNFDVQGETVQLPQKYVSIGDVAHKFSVRRL